MITDHISKSCSDTLSRGKILSCLFNNNIPVDFKVDSFMQMVIKYGPRAYTELCIP